MRDMQVPYHVEGNAGFGIVPQALLALGAGDKKVDYTL